MAKPAKHARVPDLPCISALPGARLDGFHEERRGKQPDLVVDYHEFQPSEPAVIGCEQGNLFERVKGSYVPRRLRFYGVRSIQCNGLCADLDRLPPDHPVRSLRGVMNWIPGDEKDLVSTFIHDVEEPARLRILSRGCRQEDRGGAAEAVELVRDWSPSPPFRAGLIPDLKRMHSQFGGDPITIRLGGRAFRRRLFVGGVEYQAEHRPQVEAVLNLGEEPSRWVKNGQVHPSDRQVVRGEGMQGMSVLELTEEANWVITRLREGQRVLVHCVAGLNRSTTVCCAALILSEGLSAEAALARVRERHGWARPDEYHWLALKWLAKTRS